MAMGHSSYILGFCFSAFSLDLRSSLIREGVSRSLRGNSSMNMDIPDRRLLDRKGR
jgi:hypothetical protein